MDFDFYEGVYDVGYEDFVCRRYCVLVECSIVFDGELLLLFFWVFVWKELFDGEWVVEV